MNQISVTDRPRRIPGHLIVLSCIALLLLTWSGCLWHADHALQVERDLVLADGYPLTVADLRAYYPEPDRPHAGQVYEQAFEMMDMDAPGIPLYDTSPTPPTGVRWPPEALEASVQFLAKNDEALQLLRQATDMGPAWFPQWFNDESPGFLRHVLGFRRAISLLTLKTRVHAQLDESAYASDAAMMAWHLTDALREEPNHDSFLFRAGIISSLVGVTERLNSEVALSREQLIALAEVAAATKDDGRALLRAAAGERVEMLEKFERLRRGEEQHISTHLAASLVMTGRLQRDITATLRLERAAIELAEGRINSANALEKQWKALPRHHFPYESFAPLCWLGIQLNKHYHARVDALVLALAAQRFHLDHGSYPDTLDALIPTYVQSIPTDRFSDGPLQYRRTQTGAIVYSVGRDGIDDGGRERHTQIRQSSLREGTDITFTLGDAQRELWPEEWNDWPLNPAEAAE